MTFVNHRCTGGFTYFTLHFIHATFCIEPRIDFKEVKNVTGVQTTHWGAGYAPSKVEIFSSENGDDWVSIGQWDTKGRTQTITFDERVKTRYLKYQMITVPSRVDITRFYIYAW